MAEKNEVWNIDTIHKRSKELIDFMKEQWSIEFNEDQEYYLTHGKEKPKGGK